MKSENFLVITFNDDSKAIEASHRLQDLAMRGDISLGYNVMLKKNADGKIEAMEKETSGGRTTWTGMLIGMLVGLFMGPFGFLLSMLAGTAIGAGMDASKGHFEEGFTDQIQNELDAGKVAIVARCDEQSPAFVDNAMKDLEAHVTRSIYTGEKQPEAAQAPPADAAK